MKNPWTRLEGSRDGYVLDEDLDAIGAFNRSAREPRVKIVFDVLPEPFIGNPDLAKLVLLGLNPGYSASDPEWHARKDFRRALLLNLNHELTDYPFYPLNPAFRESGAGQWWRERTRRLQDESGLDDRRFAERVMVIETQETTVAPRSIGGPILLPTIAITKDRSGVHSFMPNPRSGIAGDELTELMDCPREPGW